VIYIIGRRERIEGEEREKRGRREGEEREKVGEGDIYNREKGIYSNQNYRSLI
jgi:hypothetical protein